MTEIQKLTYRLTTNGYSAPVWDDLAGASGAYTSQSGCGKFEALALPEGDAFNCYLIDVSDGSVVAVVPQIPELIGRAIMEAENG